LDGGIGSETKLTWARARCARSWALVAISGLLTPQAKAAATDVMSA